MKWIRLLRTYRRQELDELWYNTQEDREMERAGLLEAKNTFALRILFRIDPSGLESPREEAIDWNLMLNPDHDLPRMRYIN